MSIDGVWNIIVNSPLGAQKSTLTLKSDGGSITGTAQGANESGEIVDGKLDGQQASWKTSVTQPFPLTLEFVGTVADDKISGEVKAGNFGSFAFAGERA